VILSISQPGRVQVDVPGKFCSVFVSLDQDRLLPSLEQVPGPFSLYVEVRRIGAVHMPHDLREISFRCLQKQMIMVAHQAICMDYRSIPFRCRAEIFKKFLPVSLAFEYVLLFVASRGDMVKCARIDNP